MFFVPPRFYDEIMKKVPHGKLVSISQLYMHHSCHTGVKANSYTAG